MEYEIFRKIVGKEDFFKQWDQDSYTTLTSELMNEIYDKYVVKCHVFQRDNFKCQNIECKFPNSSLTFHHIKWKKNFGKDKVRNGVTLCHTCHKSFHRAKKALIFGNFEYLPSHIRNKSFRLHKPDKIDWKKIKAKMRVFRKTLKSECNLRLSAAQISLLLKWLYYLHE